MLALIWDLSNIDLQMLQLKGVTKSRQIVRGEGEHNLS
uniref:Uncharacterized protein n=1 Tax=Rhizophora mucronata TaxID=61149 RepID=A0A2P2JEA5_RHIMU